MLSSLKVSGLNTFDRQWQRWFPEDRDKQPTGSGGRRRRIVKWVLSILAALIALFILLNVLKGFYTEWLWFSSLGYGSVYTTILRTRVLIFFLAAVIFCCLFLGNLVLATHLAPKSEADNWPWLIVSQLTRMSKRVIALVTASLSLIFGLIAQGNWEVVLRYFNGQPFGTSDPVFHKDISFYVFSLPFLNWLRGWLLGALIVTLLGIIGVYLSSYMLQRRRLNFDRSVLIHVGTLGAVILGLFAWGYWLGIWELVFSTQGVVFGASYTDMHAKLPAQWVLLAVVLICVALLVVVIWRRNFRWVLYGVAGWVAAAIIMGAIFPYIVQRFQVQPNELIKETPYIEYNIQCTRDAFGLSHIEELPFPAEEAPTPQDVIQNEVTIDNVRLWDHRPLKDTYTQIQSLRSYYDFNDVDIDRYDVDGEYRQVMLSARELYGERLSEDAQTWVNRRLLFTHGYGLALSLVNEVSDEGLPVLRVKDIPPVGDFNIEQPQVYFGEKTDDYVIVKTDTEEFDYPSGEENVYGSYQGSGGVSLNGFIRRFVYAWQMGDFNILISGSLTPESRILYYRDIQERVNHLAPFLELDSDPYLVVMDGRLFWIQDAYTTSNRYPYSEPLDNGLNYVRNSVKAVIDAYNGGVTFYVADAGDALIRTYQAIFPTLFVSIDQMPESLRAHIRYPEDMFSVQAAVYRTYHMQDARVFYNREDLWAVPTEVYFGGEQLMEPYYIIMRLPDEDEEEFLLMLPFTPANKENAIGWMAARCDDEHYGKLIAYFFPKERRVYGPSQIENLIQQDTDITEQFALWDRGGSRVIRGNLLMIPLGDSMLYVEPVFLQAVEGGLPELKRVIVSTGEQIAMEPTLAESIAAIFGTEEPPDTTETEPPVTPEPEEEPLAAEIAELIAEAQQHYEQAQQYLRDGDWAGYGREMEALEAVLAQLAELIAESE